MTNRTANAEWQFTGWHMLAILIAFFGVVISVNLTLAYFANASWSGLIVKNSYVASQSFDKDLAIAREQHAIGWKSEAKLTRDALTVTMKDRDGLPLTGLKVIATLQRPVTESQDVKIELKEGAAGIYAQSIVIAPGNWTADITAGKGEHAVRYIERMIVR
jgi:nitrogen fixation protein FixH